MRGNGHDDAAWRRSRQLIAQWRRVYLLAGDATCMRVALLVAELARSDGAAVVCCPSHATLGTLASLSKRSVARQIALLVELGWLERTGPRARTCMSRTYRLRAPVPQTLLDAATARRGMWRALADCMPTAVTTRVPTGDQRGCQIRDNRVPRDGTPS